MAGTKNKLRAIVLINETSGERQNFKSINSAAAFCGVNFAKIQTAALYNGVVKGWRVFEDADTIRRHIAELQGQLRIVEEWA